MSNDGLHDRGNAMEELFYRNQDAVLLDRMKAELQLGKDREALVLASGITDEKVLADLLANGIRQQTLASVGLIPLVAVAWADGKVDQRERDAILKAARETGMSDDHSSMDLIKGWLNTKPGPELLAAWKVYVRELRKTLTPASLEQVRSSVVGRAQTVAEAAGGFLGIVNTVDASEKSVIKELNQAFE